MPLGYPEIGGCLSTCLPGTLPRRVTVPTSQPPPEVYSERGQYRQQGRHNPHQVQGLGRTGLRAVSLTSEERHWHSEFHYQS